MNKNSPPPDDLIERIKQKDEQAYRTVHAQFYLPLFQFTYGLLKDRPTAEDIVSSSFIKAWKMSERFDTLNNLKAFLLTVCRHEAYDFLRYHHGQTEKHTILHDDLEKFLENKVLDEDISHALIRSEVINTIFQEIKKLPGQRKEVITLLFIEGLDTREVSRRMGLSEGSVRSTKAKALEQLRNNPLLKKLLLAVTLLIRLAA
ncbi:RNA polymerase sigma factor [Pseudoflavitalea sp. X16]|uniref:RNA polymerase sigma factor n=1 Tax=Paraflavitalea devenefica TaxID=2716334 RepID=UPI00141FA474|nr:RNA polymerase sigma factor [Paraflavitalea devenefica]NII26722.1 RNA polymerase sigma factor [Paraflavitalea devenefica]